MKHTKQNRRLLSATVKALASVLHTKNNFKSVPQSSVGVVDVLRHTCGVHPIAAQGSTKIYYLAILSHLLPSLSH